MEQTETGYRQPGKNWLEGYVYVLDYGDNETFKIGYTSTSPGLRLSQITKDLPVIMPKVALVMSVYTSSNCRYVEQLLHMLYDCKHIKGEWFNLSFVDLLEIHGLFYRIGPPVLYDRWYEIVPEDAPEAARAGNLDWVGALPHFTREQEKEQWDALDNWVSSMKDRSDYE